MPPAARDALDTPLLRQYKALKAGYPHAVLLFRLGDFYEMFGEDARAASPVLGVVLTKRQGLPMCGVPYHSAPQYINKLLKAGHKVAVADQLEDPSTAKGLVKRAVTRLLTPGTIVEDEFLDGVAANYLVSLELDTVGWGLACVEVSTGEFWATQALNDHGHLQLFAVLAKLDPAEVLVSAKSSDELKLKAALKPKASITHWQQAAPGQLPEWGTGEPWPNRPLALRAAAKARDYVAATSAHLRDILVPVYRESLSAMQLDEAAIRTLELVASAEGLPKFSLWGVLDRTKTPMGSRKLRKWVLHPSTELAEIHRRQHCVEELLEHSERRARLGRLLEGVCDLERIINRMATRAASPRDLGALRDSLRSLPSLEEFLGAWSPDSGIATLGRALGEIEEPIEGLSAVLEKAIADHPPARLSDGGIIREGYDSSLDELRAIKTDSRQYLAELEARERDSTGIPSLKVGYNSVFGFYLEVTRSHQEKVPARYVRKQTLVGAERYITPELKELELKVLGAEDKIIRLEASLFERLREEALKADRELRRLAALMAALDVLGSLSEAAAHGSWVKPAVDLGYAFEVEEGRHPIVESFLPAGTFVPNSIKLDGADPQSLVLTGPNMGGKSVFLRQSALIAVLAQMGSFVPAKSARVGLVDKILTRIGARDQLARGESTFMVEMRETSHILKSATLRSLILLDEVGRGTSTFDGISIAWAVLEHLNSFARLSPKPPPKGAPRGPRTLFATHYFELTELAGLLEGVKNINVEAREWTNSEGRTEVIFLHKISPGPADRSFGIHVAELAGIPQSVLARAREILHGLENEARATPAPAAGRRPEAEPSLPLFDEHPVLHELRLLDPDQVAPMDALRKIHEWKTRL